MPDVRISHIAEATGFSPRYWQRRIKNGEVPGAKYVNCGSRRIFLIDENVFNDWYSSQKVEIPCQRTLSKETRRGGIVSPMQENSIKARWEQTNSKSLKTVLRSLSKN